MHKKTCACGKSEKNFHLDIGPFYVGDCCLDSGYDELGKKAGHTAQELFEMQTNEITEKSPEPAQPQKLSKGRLKDMRVLDLRNLALSRGLPVDETMTKNQLIEQLLK